MHIKKTQSKRHTHTQTDSPCIFAVMVVMMIQHLCLHLVLCCCCCCCVNHVFALLRSRCATARRQASSTGELSSAPLLWECNRSLAPGRRGADRTARSMRTSADWRSQVDAEIQNVSQEEICSGPRGDHVDGLNLAGIRGKRPLLGKEFRYRLPLPMTFICDGS